MYDLREDSPTKGELQEVYFGEDNYCLVQIPPGIANGYKAYGDKMVDHGELRHRAARSRTKCCVSLPSRRRFHTTGDCSMARRSVGRFSAKPRRHSDASPGQIRRWWDGPGSLL